MLSLREVSKRYGSILALQDVTLDIKPGEIVALVGENGAGKSTLVRCIAGDKIPEHGDISIAGLPLGTTPRGVINQGVSVVWQDLALCENLDVTSNLFLGREIAVVGGGLRRAAMRSEAAQLFASLGAMVPDLERPIERLSGGQRQMVAIARAMLDVPRVLILDEPTAALGIAERQTILETIEGLRAQGVAILLVSHQLDDVFEVADRVAVLRQGRLVGNVARSQTHPDDIVALITGVDVETTAGQQLRRLHSLAEQLTDAEQSSVLPLTVTSLSNALNIGRLGIFLVDKRDGESTLRQSASLNLPLKVQHAVRELSGDANGGFLRDSVTSGRLTIVERLQDLVEDSVASAAMDSGLVGAWASPIQGRTETLALIVGFTDVRAQLHPDQVQLLELFSTMAAAAIERSQLVEELRERNQSLEGLHDVLETLAGPALLVGGMSTALDALRHGAGCAAAALYTTDSDGTFVPKAQSIAPGHEARHEANIDLEMARIAGGHQETPATVVSQFAWSQGDAVLICIWDEDTAPPAETRPLIEGAANSFRLALERELAAEAQQQAAAIHRSREIERELTRRFGHELRTPLTAIQGFASTMLQPDVVWPDSEKERFLEIIEAEAGRMGRLVARLFDDSALGSGTLRLDHNYCDLVAVIEQAVSIVGHHDALDLDLPSDLTIWADKDRVEQIVVNLVGNAVQHNPDGTRIAISLARDDDPNLLCLEIADNGVGLPAHLVSYLNGHARRRDDEHGLGTRLVRGFVAAHGGTLDVTSTNNGTRIVVRLPIEPQP